MAVLTPEDMGRIADGAKLAGLLPYVQDDLERMMNGVVTKTLMALNKGDLTPDLALYGWMELNVYDRLLKRLSQRVTLGQSLGEKHSSTISGEYLQTGGTR